MFQVLSSLNNDIHVDEVRIISLSWKFTDHQKIRTVLVALHQRFFKKIIYFWLCRIFVAACGPSWASVHGLLIVVTSVVEHRPPGCLGFCSLWSMGLAVLRHVGSSQTRDWTCLLHWQVNSLPLSHQGSPNIKDFNLSPPRWSSHYLIQPVSRPLYVTSWHMVTSLC